MIWIIAIALWILSLNGFTIPALVWWLVIPVLVLETLAGILLIVKTVRGLRSTMIR